MGGGGGGVGVDPPPPSIQRPALVFSRAPRPPTLTHPLRREGVVGGIPSAEGEVGHRTRLWRGIVRASGHTGGALVWGAGGCRREGLWKYIGGAGAGAGDEPVGPGPGEVDHRLALWARPVATGGGVSAWE